MPGGERDPDGDQREEDELPPRVEAERALVRQLDEVVEKADRAAGEGDEEHRQRRHLVLAHGEEGDRRRHEHEEAADCRRPLLLDMPLRPLLADVLAELVPPQELDELRADDDRDDHRHDGRNENPGQAATPASASTTASSPIAREPLTSTQSPGSTTSRTAASPSSSVGAQRTVSTPSAPSR